MRQSMNQAIPQSAVPHAWRFHHVTRRALVVGATVIAAVAALPSTVATARADAVVSPPGVVIDVQAGQGGSGAGAGAGGEQCGPSQFDYGSVSMQACIDEYYSKPDSSWKIDAAGQMRFFNTNPSQWSRCVIDVELYIDATFNSAQSYDCYAAAKANGSGSWANGAVVPLRGTHTYQSVTWWWGTYAGNPVQSSGPARSPVVSFTGH
jgi:hypothetical protein